jgi:LemA protein
MTRIGRLGVLVTSVLMLSCGIQSIPASKNNVEAQLAEITNQYKRRADLVPNLVAAVKGYAAHEQQTLTGVVEARAKATSAQINFQKLDPKEIAQYQQAQSALSQALGRLMVLSENYPQLKADQSFRDLQAQLEGTENRIAVARNRYIESIKEFNNLVTVPPSSWTNALFYHHEKLPQWDVDAAEKKSNETAPAVKF